MGPSESCPITETKLRRIAWLSAREPKKVFHQLMHHFNEASLADCFHELDGCKAVGADGVTKAEYGERLDENIQDLTARMKRMAYRPGPVREVLIPKPEKPDATRPLGVSNLEDKIVQKMMQKVLEGIYEPIMLPCSYGFRRGKSCHDAVKALRQHLFDHEVEAVIDVDISNFFGTIDRHMLDKMLRQKIGDQRLIRYIHRMCLAGILRDDELEVDDEGVIQGSMCSPVLANIYAHYVIDVWFEDVVKKHCKGRVELFRYADDAVICCRHQSDAERIKRALVNRLAKYNLHLNEDKTRCVPFSKRQPSRERKQNTFDFLGFNFYWGRSIRGAVIPKVKTSPKRLCSKLKALTQWIKAVKDRMKLKAAWELFCAKLRGHYQYYGVSFNFAGINQFLHEAKRILFKWLNRRSQRRSFSWEKFQLFIARHPPPPVKIHHRLF
jgi:RNA-directed DNA polymerase